MACHGVRLTHGALTINLLSGREAQEARKRSLRSRLNSLRSAAAGDSWLINAWCNAGVTDIPGEISRVEEELQ